MKTFITNSPIETEAVAESLSKVLRGGEVIAFRGDLGAGKTCFTRGLARGLEFSGAVTSPTFAIVNEYADGKGRPIYHFDMYRIKSVAELYNLGYEDYFYSGATCLIEWPELAEELEVRISEAIKGNVEEIAE